MGEVCVGRADAVPFMEGRSVALGESRVAVFHTESGFVALDAACPHEGGPLADGIVSASCVTCPLHGWRIDLRSGEVVGGGEGRVAVHEVAERGGALFVAAPDAAIAARS